MTNSIDGSHVLLEAWGFVKKLMAEGLIVKYDSGDDEDYSEYYPEEVYNREDQD